MTGGTRETSDSDGLRSVRAALWVRRLSRLHMGHRPGVTRSRSKVLKITRITNGLLSAEVGGMKMKPLHSLTVLALCMSGGCDAPATADEVGHDLRADDLDEGSEDYTVGDRLDQSPYLVEIEAGLDSWAQLLDLGALEAEESMTVFIETYGEHASARLLEPESGELLAEAEPFAEIEEDGGETRLISTLKIDPALAKGIMKVDFQPDPRARLLLCDEVVVNRNDSGPGSLRQAVADVRNGGSVCFDPIEFDSKAPLVLHSEILVAKDITFLGSTADGVVIDGDRTDRLFNLGTATNTVMRELFLGRGEAFEGGIIKNRGTLSMRECGVGEGAADRGGAIYSDEGIVYLWDSVVAGNEAGLGGAVYCDDCRLYVDDSQVSGNTAEQGGAFYSDLGTVVVRDGARVFQNSAEEGGGLYAHSPGGVTGALEIRGGSYHNNYATLGAGAFLLGGRLSVTSDPSNGTPYGAISGNISSEDGGGVYVEGGFVDVGPLASIRGNLAAGDGGGVYNLGQVSMTGHGKISNNQVGGRGGGVYNLGSVELRGDADIEDNTADGDGGGVYNDGYMVILDEPCRVRANLSGAQGGGVYNTSAGNLVALEQIQIVANAPDNVFDSP